ncbi:hypothetical protein Rsub_03094 [Raphidocelis subcapitata]|uniref:Uncharacterized protein n=1 Tax=Raphidocelis subcapitata TaxID=307507 RepID=A0A2V0NYY9_9CHLO|nr:hypothetical protein Rsub_03094 [Raphidocelis subcapitata]|eukprot:GBF90793.1 hypothetical protein Rsub_03094 [Raphidocelis subcapitata]
MPPPRAAPAEGAAAPGTPHAARLPAGGSGQGKTSDAAPHPSASAILRGSPRHLDEPATGGLEDSAPLIKAGPWGEAGAEAAPATSVTPPDSQRLAPLNVPPPAAQDAAAPVTPAADEGRGRRGSEGAALLSPRLGRVSSDGSDDGLCFWLQPPWELAPPPPPLQPPRLTAVVAAAEGQRQQLQPTSPQAPAVRLPPWACPPAAEPTLPRARASGASAAASRPARISTFSARGRALRAAGFLGSGTAKAAQSAAAAPHAKAPRGKAVLRTVPSSALSRASGPAAAASLSREGPATGPAAVLRAWSVCSFSLSYGGKAAGSRTALAGSLAALAAPRRRQRRPHCMRVPPPAGSSGRGHGAAAGGKAPAPLSTIYEESRVDWCAR